MGIYTYCVVPPDHAVKSRTGIGDAPVELLASCGLGVVASPLSSRPEPSVDHIRQHNEVVLAAVTETVTPVPIRFGQWVPDLAALEDGMTRRAQDFGKLLLHFAGTLEFGLRILDPRVAETTRAPDARSGREYLLSLQEARRLTQPLRDAQEQASRLCAPLVRAERSEQNGPAGLVSLSHLVPHSQTEAYRQVIQQLRDSLPDLRFLVSGPWPPYSFAL